MLPTLKSCIIPLILFTLISLTEVYSSIDDFRCSHLDQSHEKWKAQIESILYLRAAGREEQRARTEPLKVRKVLSSSSSEKNGCRATRLMNLDRARRLPSMNSRSDDEVKTAAKGQWWRRESFSQTQKRGQHL